MSISQSVNIRSDHGRQKVRDPAPDRLLKTAEAAELLNVSVAFLERQRWLRAGPPHIRVSGPTGRAVRYRRSDLLGWIEGNRIDHSA